MTSRHVHKTCVIFLCLLLALACAAGSAHAACAFSPPGASSGVIAFSAINPSTSPGPVYGTVTTPITFTCAPAGRAFTVTANPASGWSLTGAGSIPYTLGFITGGTSLGAGAPNRISLLTNAPPNASLINMTNYRDAPAGVYNNGAQAVSFTINCPTCTGTKTIVATIPGTSGVTANPGIANTCGSAIGGSMSFNINPAGLGTLTPATTDAGNTSPSVKCTKNAAHAVACSSVHANTLTIGNDGVTDPIAYTITGCPASLTGSGFSTATPIPVGISILQTAYQDARVGAHSDTITITVTY